MPEPLVQGDAAAPSSSLPVSPLAQHRAWRHQSGFQPHFAFHRAG